MIFKYYMYLFKKDNRYPFWFLPCNVSKGGTAPPTSKLACIVFYLKIINTFLKNDIYESFSKFSKDLKNSINIKVGRAVLEILIQTTFWLFWSKT